MIISFTCPECSEIVTTCVLDQDSSDPITCPSCEAELYLDELNYDEGVYDSTDALNSMNKAFKYAV